MIAMLPMPSPASASVSRTILAAAACTYGQWLQMNMTTSPFGPRALVGVCRLPSMPGRSKCAAGHPSAIGDEAIVMVVPPVGARLRRGIVAPC
jgi:hypothetical protein